MTDRISPYEYFSACSDCPVGQYKPEHTSFPIGTSPWDSHNGRARLIASSAPVMERNREEKQPEEEEEEETKNTKPVPAMWRRHSLTDTRILRPTSCWGSQYLSSIYEKEMDELMNCFDKADKDKKNWINEDELCEIYRIKKINLSMKPVKCYYLYLIKIAVGK